MSAFTSGGACSSAKEQAPNQHEWKHGVRAAIVGERCHGEYKGARGGDSREQ